MTADQSGEAGDGLRPPLRADYFRYEERRREDPDSRNWIAIDKTTAIVIGAVASAALAVAIAGGTALVQKVEDTSKAVDKGRADRIADFGEMSKNVAVVETKLNQLISQITQLEVRIERSVTHDLEVRDRRIEEIDRKAEYLREQLNETLRERDRQRPAGR
ncbi:MAG: hypothetical protein IPK66_04635 [Rhodospirillales bacterium]|nr:hypothetical protein [Rhodospirillales bacterium]